jgi:hypothetical protein
MVFQKRVCVVLALTVFTSCAEKKGDSEEKLTIQPQLLRLPHAETPPGLAGPRLIDPSAETSLMQSFTPTSIRLSINDIGISDGDASDWNAPSQLIYRCAGTTNEECMVEVANLQAFEDALNAEPAEIQPGTYTKVRVSMCAQPGGMQRVEITGSATLNGVTYVTDPTAGIVAGAIADAKPVAFHFAGCAVQIPLAQALNAELNEEQEAEVENCPEGQTCAPTVSAKVGLRLLFDSYHFAAMGNMLNDATKQLVAGAADNLSNISFNQDNTDCKGDKSGLFLCTQRTALYATDDQGPVIKRFAVTLTDTAAVDGRPAIANPDPTAYTALMLRGDGVPVAAYTRRSVHEGAAFNLSMKGDENYFNIETNADGSFKLTEGPLGSTANPTYSAFAPQDHTGERLKLNGIDLAPYKATLLP